VFQAKLDSATYSKYMKVAKDFKENLASFGIRRLRVLASKASVRDLFKVY
jgi:hypothetical protein